MKVLLPDKIDGRRNDIRYSKPNVKKQVLTIHAPYKGTELGSVHTQYQISADYCNSIDFIRLPLIVSINSREMDALKKIGMWRMINQFIYQIDSNENILKERSK